MFVRKKPAPAGFYYSQSNSVVSSFEPSLSSVVSSPAASSSVTPLPAVQSFEAVVSDPVLAAPFMVSMIRTATAMYEHGWDERNAGNISLLLEEKDLSSYIDTTQVIRTITLDFYEPLLAGKYFLVTGAGKYFKNIPYDPANNLGIIRISKDAKAVELLWGFSDGTTVTSELPAHLMTHAVRLKHASLEYEHLEHAGHERDRLWRKYFKRASFKGEHRGYDKQSQVVMHCHPTNLLAMTFVHSLDERAFTRTLWQMCTECIMVFPDGVGVLPWMLCGTTAIGQATAEKMKDSRLVVWGQHGIYATASTLDEAFGLIETAEKAAEVYMKIAHLPHLNTITDDQLRQVAEHLNLTVRAGYL